jgi:hypothetical protein
MGLGGFGEGPFGPLKNERRLSDLTLAESKNQLSLRDQFLGGMTNNSFGSLSLFPERSPILAPQPSSIQEGFATTLSRIELDSTRVQRASQHYKSIKDWLESKLSVEVRQIGSFQRSTKIRPSVINGVSSPIDIDAIVCFGDATFFATPGFGQTGFDALKAVRDALIAHKTYRILEPKIDHPVVTLSYASEFSVELVPCFRNRMAPDNWNRIPPSYLVSNSIGLWELADYDYDSAYITASNKDCDGKLIPAIKLIKQFVRNKNIGLKSFHIELLCVKIFVPYITVLNQAGIKWTWNDLLSLFLNSAPAVLLESVALPGSRSIVPAIVEPQRVIRELLEWGTIAGKLSQLTFSPEVYKLWRQFYGDPFPAL